MFSGFSGVSVRLLAAHPCTAVWDFTTCLRTGLLWLPGPNASDGGLSHGEKAHVSQAQRLKSSQAPSHSGVFEGH